LFVFLCGVPALENAAFPSPLDIDCQEQVFLAGSENGLFDGAFPRPERTRVAAFAEHEAFKLAEAIVDHFNDATGIANQVGGAAVLRRAVGRWWNRAGIASESLHARRQVRDIPLQDGT
jgi:hypothetical protein